MNALDRVFLFLFRILFYAGIAAFLVIAKLSNWRQPFSEIVDELETIFTGEIK